MMNSTKLLFLMWETVKCRLHMTHRLTKLTQLQLDLNYINLKITDFELALVIFAACETMHENTDMTVGQREALKVL